MSEPFKKKLLTAGMDVVCSSVTENESGNVIGNGIGINLSIIPTDTMVSIHMS